METEADVHSAPEVSDPLLAGRHNDVMFAVIASAPKQSDVTPSCGFGLRTAAR